MAFDIFPDVKSFGIDGDGDYVVNNADNCKKISNNDQLDFDKDSQGNLCDSDDDDDGVLDSLDFFDSDPNEWADFDFDGVGTNSDPDDDNDGIADMDDKIPLHKVEEFATKYRKDLEWCLDTVDETKQLLCLDSFFKNVIQNGDDAKIALELAAILPKIGSVNDCHFISHSIGTSTFDVTQDLSKSFELGEKWCRSGFYHGVMVSYFHYLKENEQKLENIENTCKPLEGTVNFQNCIHGLGHGLIHYYGEDLTTATNTCNSLSYYPDTICLGGIMMQYTDEALSTSDNLENTIQDICNDSKLDQLESQYCYIGLGISIAAHTDNDLKKSMDYCAVLDEEQNKHCELGARREIAEAQQSDVVGLPESKTEILQSFAIKNDKRWIVDIVSSAQISNFAYGDESFMFSTDTVSPITIYMSRTLLPDFGSFAVNGVIQTDVEIQSGLVGNYVMIKLTPEEFGTVSLQQEKSRI